MKKRVRNKRLTAKLLPAALLLSVLLAFGCKSTTPGSFFSKPTFKSNKPSPQKPKKDPGTPTSVEEWLVQPRSGF